MRMSDETATWSRRGSSCSFAERFDLVSEIDRWVVSSAIEILVERHRLGSEISSR